MYSDIDSLFSVPVTDNDKMSMIPEHCALDRYKDDELADTYHELVALPCVHV